MTSRLIDYKNQKPTIASDVYLSDNVIIAGDVTLKKGANIWFNSIIRGDVAPVIIGENTNIQDGCVVHTSRFDNGKTIVGDNVNVGHMALLHACQVHDNAFIGMKSCLMDGSIVEEFGFVGAGSLLSPGKIVRKNELWIGSPARFARMINDKEKAFMQENITNYLSLAKTYKQNQKL